MNSSINNFCTITTNGYLLKCLALYESIDKHTDGNYHLWICSVDKAAYELLLKLDLPHITVVHVEKIENKALIEAKNNRYKNEYCWTIKASFIKYVLKHNEAIDSILYVDSDTFLFSEPEVLFDSLKHNDILLTNHNFTHGFYHLYELKGKYNAGIVGFKNNKRAFRLLNWWEKNCIKWCYNQVIPNRFADQKYLETLGDKYLRTAKNASLGVNTAMWNMQDRIVMKKGDKTYINNDPLIIYHFSSFFIINEKEFDLWNCDYTKPDVHITELIYIPYIKSIMNAIEIVKKIETDITEFLTDKYYTGLYYNHFIVSETL